MRVIQLIDSLDTGGAERMAVNFANLLSDYIDGSYLCATRHEGLLKKSINDSVSYLYLNKKSTLNIKSIFKLYRYIKAENISIIHAHSSSFFLGACVKLLYPRVKLIWHDHYGNSELLETRPFKTLKLCSRLYDAVFCVNSKLVIWNKEKLKTNSIFYFSNFVLPRTDYDKTTNLKGFEGKRIICLANLRPQKDHLNLLTAFHTLSQKFEDWTLHVVGKDFKDAYSKSIKEYVLQNNLNEKVFFYGGISDTDYAIGQSTIGVLSSKSEGLPLSLIEYGFAGLAIVSTDVGDCSRVIKDNTMGRLVKPNNSGALRGAIEDFINDTNLRNDAGQNIQKHVNASFSRHAVKESLISNYTKIMSK